MPIRTNLVLGLVLASTEVPCQRPRSPLICSGSKGSSRPAASNCRVPAALAPAAPPGGDDWAGMAAGRRRDGPVGGAPCCSLMVIAITAHARPAATARAITALLPGSRGKTRAAERPLIADERDQPHIGPCSPAGNTLPRSYDSRRVVHSQRRLRGAQLSRGTRDAVSRGLVTMRRTAVFAALAAAAN